MLRHLLAILLIVASSSAIAVEPAKEAKKEVIPHAQSVPPGPALSPAEAIKKMTVPEGFSVELVAAEPDIVNPVAMTFDERGRVWITESLEYPRHSPGPGRDRIKVLEDTDGDGRADKFTIFAEGLNIPSGIAVGYGGVWVANAPDILFMQDTDGDGRADKQEVVVTGFGRSDTHELPNSLTWGPDGWLYGLNGVFNPCKVTHKGKTHEFTCAMFRIHPRTRDFELFCEGTSNPWGIAIDKEGSFFVSACVIDHLWHLVETGYYHRQGGPYPPFTWKIESIVKHKHQKAAYCGIHYFDSDAYPEQYREKLYMGNIHGNCINVDRLERDGSTYRGLPEPDFLTANDAWFMPIVQKTGPDGCLYILDWYDRYHCYQDARRDPEGIDRLKGRLYRVRYKDTPRAPKFNLAKESDEQLIERLKSPNVFYRDVAQRLLAERQVDRTTLDHLSDLVRDSNTSFKTRLHAMWVIAGIEPRWLADSGFRKHADPYVRAWSIRSNPKLADQDIKEPLAPEERLQIVIAAGKGSTNSSLHSLVAAMRDAPADLHLARIAWQSLNRLSVHRQDIFSEFLRQVQSDLERGRHPAFEALVFRSLDRMDAGTIPYAVTLLLGMRESNPQVFGDCLTIALNNISSGQWKKDLFKSHIYKLRNRKGMSNEAFFTATRLTAILGESEACDDLMSYFVSEKTPLERRGLAFDSLVLAKDDRVENLARLAMTDGATPLELRRSVLLSIRRDSRLEFGELIADSYKHLDPELLPIAIEILIERPAWAELLVKAVEDKEIAVDELNVNQIRQLLFGKNQDLVERVKAIWGTVRTDRNPQREQVVYEMRNLLKNNSGDPHKGTAVFQKLCGQCHKMHGQGQDVGPDITVNGRASLDQLLSNVFDPSLVIGRIYQAYTVVTADGRTLTGLLVEDSPQRIVLKTQGGKIETIARKDVDEFEQSKLSMMPEGVEKQLSQQELLDLLAFLRLDKPPSDPTAKLIPDVKK